MPAYMSDPVCHAWIASGSTHDRPHEPEPLSPAAASPVAHASASAASLPRDALVPSPFGGDVLDAFLAFDENEIPIIV